MLVAGFPAGPFGTNCWVLATGPNTEAVIVDPGMDVSAGITSVLAEHHLRPVAVLLTHGHLDHMWSVTPVADGYDIPAYIHPADRHLLVDPFAGSSPEVGAMFARMVGATGFVEPASVAELVDGGQFEIAGLTFTTRHAPGHTQGSTAFELPTGAEPVLVTGDLLFAGSVGRTDLPGGDPVAMVESLRKVVLPQPDDTLVLPGHGPTTTIGAERASNPYLPREGAR